MAKRYRVKCSNCNEMVNVTEDKVCPKCNAPLSFRESSGIQIYRMGSPFGVAGAYEILINGVTYGRIGNKENIFIPLAYGTYSLHFCCGLTKSPIDVTVSISLKEPKAFVKIATKVGFWTNDIIASIVSKNEMPPLE